MGKNQKESGSSKCPKIRTLLNAYLLESPKGLSDEEHEAEKDAASQLLQIAALSKTDLGSKGFMKDLAKTSSTAGEGLFVPISVHSAIAKYVGPISWVMSRSPQRFDPDIVENLKLNLELCLATDCRVVSPQPLPTIAE